MLEYLLAFALPFVSAATAPVTCQSLPGLDAVLATKQLNYLLVGEYHGTVEMPQIAADALCAAAMKDRPVILGVEFTPDNQATLDAYLVSDGGPAARAALLTGPAWQVAEGRTTVAVLEMIDMARQLKRAGKRVSIVAFDRVPTPAVSREREAALAQGLMDARARVSGGLVVALTGAGHAGKTPWSSQNPPFPATGQLLTDGETIALTFARPGGQYWGCSAPNGDRSAGCIAYDMPAREPVPARGIVLDRTLRDGFEGVFSAGKPYTASRPARTIPETSAK
ncbi:MAG TPA: hypothetical protein VGE27_01990 [Gemmatimonas sp.]|uniref:hypothetical protein n=1 Tax=Gemmatimonas sp. TaxID=1962908 RepID=UPI002EDA1308